jgi:serine/threonine protein kinase
MAPEVAEGGHYHTPADVFSFGMVLCELLLLKPANSKSFSDLEKAKKIPSKLQKLAISCLETDASERPSFEDIVTVLEDEYSLLSGGTSVSSRQEIAALKKDKLDRDVLLNALRSQFVSDGAEAKKKQRRAIATGVGGVLYNIVCLSPVSVIKSMSDTGKRCKELYEDLEESRTRVKAVDGVLK